MSTTNLQLYTLANIYVNGQLLSEESQLVVDHMTNSQIVETVAKAYAGESPGAPRVELSVTNAVPSTDFEFDPTPFMKDLLEVKFDVFYASNVLTFRGFIISSNFSHAVNTPSKLEFKARGTFQVNQPV